MTRLPCSCIYETKLSLQTSPGFSTVFILLHASASIDCMLISGRRRSCSVHESGASLLQFFSPKLVYDVTKSHIVQCLCSLVLKTKVHREETTAEASGLCDLCDLVLPTSFQTSQFQRDDKDVKSNFIVQSATNILCWNLELCCFSFTRLMTAALSVQVSLDKRRRSCRRSSCAPEVFLASPH